VGAFACLKGEDSFKLIGKNIRDGIQNKSFPKLFALKEKRKFQHNALIFPQQFS